MHDTYKEAVAKHLETIRPLQECLNKFQWQEVDIYGDVIEEVADDEEN